MPSMIRFNRLSIHGTLLKGGVSRCDFDNGQIMSAVLPVRRDVGYDAGTAKNLKSVLKSPLLDLSNQGHRMVKNMYIYICFS